MGGSKWPRGNAAGGEVLDWKSEKPPTPTGVLHTAPPEQQRLRPFLFDSSLRPEQTPLVAIYHNTNHMAYHFKSAQPQIFIDIQLREVNVQL